MPRVFGTDRVAFRPFSTQATGVGTAGHALDHTDGAWWADGASWVALHDDAKTVFDPANAMEGS
jgi:hypothetical protein